MESWNANRLIKIFTLIIVLVLVCFGTVGCPPDPDGDDDDDDDDGGGGSNKPDLKDSGTYYEQLIPNPVSWGEDFQALCMVGNVGEEDAGSFYIDLYASTNRSFDKTYDHFIARQLVSSMPAGGSDVIIIIEPDDMIEFPSIPTGYYYIYYVIDSTNSVDESDETNNVCLCTNDTLYVEDGGGNESGDSYEPDDFWNPTPLSITTTEKTQTHTLYPSGDEDYFTFTATEGTRYVFFSSGSTDTFAYVTYDGADDDSGDESNFHLDFVASFSGTDSLVIKASTNAENDTGEYTLHYYSIPDNGCTVTNTCLSKSCYNGDLWCYDNCGDRDHIDENCTCGCTGESCNSASCPDIELSATSHDFGDVTVWTSSPLWSFTIYNRGNEDLIVYGPDSWDGLGNTHFAVSEFWAADMTIPAGDNYSLDFRFGPINPGTDEAILNIQSNDPDEPSISLQLNGNGVEELYFF